MIDALRNHPSIVMWVPFNEGWGQHDTPEVARLGQRVRPHAARERSQRLERQGQRRRIGHAQLSGTRNARAGEKSRRACSANSAAWECRSSGHTWQQEKNWGYVSYDDAEKLTDAYVALLTAMRPLDRPRAFGGCLYANDRCRSRSQRPYDVRSRGVEDGRSADQSGGGEALFAIVTGYVKSLNGRHRCVMQYT